MELRPYQEALISEINRAGARGHNSVLAVLPTGGGKTVIGATVSKRAVEAGRSVVWIVHRRELVEQASDRLPPEVNVLTVQGLIGKPPPECDLLIIDEAHHAVARTWKAASLGGTRILGLTATPERGDRIGLDHIFQEMVLGPSVQKLIKMKHLVPVDVFAPSTRKTALAADPVDAWREHCADRQGFVFCQSVQDSIRVAEELPDAAHIDGTTPKKKRAEIIAQFRAGNIQTLSNVYVLTEGFDAPEASACVLARGAGSRSMYLQMVGRVMRPHPSKDKALLVDLKGVCHDHGLPEDDYQWGISGEGRAKAAPASIRTCQECFLACMLKQWPYGEPCPHCGDLPKALKPTTIVEEDLSLIMKPEEYSISQRKAFLAIRLHRCLALGHKAGRAAWQYKKFFGEFPPRSWTRPK